MDTRPVYTLKSKPAVIGSHDEAVERARALKPKLRERLPLGQELRRLPDENVADILESGLYGVMKPKRYGGSELGTETMIDVTVELASADPSTGWVYMLWAAHMWMQALWPESALDEMWANPNSLASSVVSTVGDVTKVDGGYHWDGRGFFSSGVDHCDWLTALVPIMKDGEQVDFRWLLIPREDLEIVDDWNTIGLRGTGSKTVIFNDIFVPEHRTLSMAAVMEGNAPGHEVNTHPMYGSISNANFTGAMSVPAIGAAKGFLQLFEERIGKKLTVPDSTRGPYVPGGLGATMNRYSEMAAQVDASHALLLLNAMNYARVPAKDVTPVENEKLRRDSTYTAQQARRAVNRLFEECGGTGIKEDSPLQQFWRDTNAAAAHHGLTWDWQAEAWVNASLEAPFSPLL